MTDRSCPFKEEHVGVPLIFDSNDISKDNAVSLSVHQFKWIDHFKKLLLKIKSINASDHKILVFCRTVAADLVKTVKCFSLRSSCRIVAQIEIVPNSVYLYTIPGMLHVHVGALISVKDRASDVLTSAQDRIQIGDIEAYRLLHLR